MKTIDVVAATNPAFIALQLRAFGEGYEKSASCGVPLSLLFLVLPLASGPGATFCFEGTNAKTGLATWLTRHPRVRLGLAARVNMTAGFTRSALLFGLAKGALSIDEELRVSVGGLRRRPRWPVADPRGALLSRSHRLGQWLGKAGTSANILTALGVSP